MIATAYTMWELNTWSGRITPVQCVAQTEKTVTTTGFRRRAKRAEFYTIHESWEQAHQEAVTRQEAKIASLREQLEQANGRLGQIRGMRPPEGVE